MGYETNHDKNWKNTMPRAERVALNITFSSTQDRFAVQRIISTLHKYRAVTTKMLHNMNNDGEINKTVLTNFARELDEVEKDLRYKEWDTFPSCEM